MSITVTGTEELMQNNVAEVKLPWVKLCNPCFLTVIFTEQLQSV